MSYDAMVFDPEAAPRNKGEFLRWYGEQTEWSDERSYDDPAITTPALRNLFLDMIKTFPAMNGPYAGDDVDDPRLTDYSIGTSVIYAGFAWSMADEAYKTMYEMAMKHGIGFYNASGSDDEIFFPVNGELVPIKKLEASEGGSRPKWNFWQL